MKRPDEVVTLVNYLEEFMNAIYHNRHDSHSLEDAVVLNKKRANLEGYIIDMLGIKITEEEHDNIQTNGIKCPDCGSDMKSRTNKTSGNQFWGCIKFPSCRGTRDSSGLSRAEREEQKFKQEQQHQQQDGFSFNKKRNPATEIGPVPSE